MKFSFKFILVSTLLIFTSLSSRAIDSANETDPLLVEAKVLPYEWAPGQGGQIEIKMTLPEGFHAYEDKFNLVILEPDGYKISPFKVEPVIKWYDKFSKKERTGMKGTATLSALLEAPSRFLKKHSHMKLELTYQACSDQFCLFPTTKLVQVPISVTMVEGSPEIKEGVPHTTAPTPSLFDPSRFEKYLGTSLLAGLVFVFLAGVFTSFTPCIFPMIPITLAVLGNHSRERSRLQNFFTSCVYVLGIATTYSLLGLVAASTGSLFGASLGNPYVLSVICIIFLAMALSMYGLFEIQVPAFIRNRFGRHNHKQSLGGAYVTGLFAGIVASPCVGPILVAILTYVASSQNKLLGFLYLFTYALGLGLIFIVLGLSNQLLKVLPRSGPWMNGSKFVLGSLMLSAFYYYLNLLLPDRWFDLSLGFGLIILASVYGAFQPVQHKKVLYHVRKGLMIAILIIGIGHTALGAFDLRPYIQGRIMADNSLNPIQKLNWQPYSEELLNKALQSNKPVILDFWADWCAACHELEEQTFTDPRVRALAGKFELLKFDATRDSQELRELKKKYKIQGLPTLIFFNQKGHWVDALTLTQFEKAEKFLDRMEKAAQ